MWQYFVEGKTPENWKPRVQGDLYFSSKRNWESRGWGWWLSLRLGLGWVLSAHYSCSPILQTRAHLSCIHSANLQRLWCVLGPVAGCVFGDMTKTWPLTLSSGLCEVKVRIFKLILSWEGTWPGGSVCLLVCFFFFFCDSWTIKRIWASKLLITDFLRNFFTITISLLQKMLSSFQ